MTRLLIQTKIVIGGAILLGLFVGFGYGLGQVLTVVETSVGIR